MHYNNNNSNVSGTGDIKYTVDASMGRYRGFLASYFHICCNIMDKDGKKQIKDNR